MTLVLAWMGDAPHPSAQARDPGVRADRHWCCSRCWGAIAVLAAAQFAYELVAPTTRGDGRRRRPKFRVAAAEASIAALPFVNMSGDPKKEYFSDGISEELLNDLANIPALRVASRTSSFAFKGKNEDIKKIAQVLGRARRA